MKQTTRRGQLADSKLQIRKAILEKAGFTQCGLDLPPPMLYLPPKIVAGKLVPGNRVFHNMYSGTHRPRIVNAFVSIEEGVSFSLFEDPGLHAASSLKSVRKCLQENDAVTFVELIQSLRLAVPPA